MQIPPTTALLNLVAALPAQGGAIAAAAAAVKPAPSAGVPFPSASASSAPAANAPAADVRPRTLPRGSVINIVT